MYRYILAIHVIFVISWMAGLFYLVRLFIYHTEAQQKPEPEKRILTTQFELMERKLWKIITIPAMIFTVAAGVWMIYLAPGLLKLPWFHYVKLSFVTMMIAYHFCCGAILKQLKRGKFKYSSFQLRMWNEIATILMVGIVFTVILKDSINWIYGLVGFLIFAIVIMIAVKIYKYFRLKLK